MFSKCSSLQQWVGRVRDETIAKDLADVKKEFHDKYYELKEERMSLIKVKVKETLGIELEVYFVKPAMMLFIGYTFTYMCIWVLHGISFCNSLFFKLVCYWKGNAVENHYNDHREERASYNIRLASDLSHY